MEVIDQYRKKIDQIDDAILSLLKDRFDIVKKIGENKKSYNISLHDSEREKNVLANIKQKAQEKKIDPNLIDIIWQAIFRQSYELEK